ncbi:hypothetical protein [Pseudotenacibaculum haliotis]|uniref:hypothetical protein n=1 Tax=Pseudotenacibaculum haliotis TaxID=1862138 RepID=UPI0036D27B54
MVIENPNDLSEKIFEDAVKNNNKQELLTQLLQLKKSFDSLRKVGLSFSKNTEKEIAKRIKDFEKHPEKLSLKMIDEDIIYYEKKYQKYKSLADQAYHYSTLTSFGQAYVNKKYAEYKDYLKEQNYYANQVNKKNKEYNIQLKKVNLIAKQEDKDIEKYRLARNSIVKEYDNNLVQINNKYKIIAINLYELYKKQFKIYQNHKKSKSTHLSESTEITIVNSEKEAEETPTVTRLDNARRLREQVKKKLNEQYNSYNNRRKTSETYTLNSPKEYGLMIIRKLAEQGDADAKKILSSNRIQEDGFTIFSYKGQPLFICYKMEIPERNEIVFRRITNDDFGLLIATEDIPSNKKGKSGLLYFDKKLNSSKKNGIGTDYGKKDFPKSTYVKTEIKYLDKSYKETSRENADYYEIRDTFLEPSKYEKSGSDELSIYIESSTTQYIRIERRDINHKLIIYRIFEEDAIDDDHTYFYNDKN